MKSFYVSVICVCNMGYALLMPKGSKKGAPHYIRIAFLYFFEKKRPNRIT